MKCVAAALSLLLAALCQGGKVPNTISSVIEQVQTIKKQGAVEAREEADTFEKFLEHAEKAKAKLTAEVKKSEDKLAELKAAAKASEQSKSNLEEEIEKTQKSIDQHNAANAEALEEREAEIATYTQQLNDTNATIVALAAAIEGLDTAAGASLLSTEKTVVKSLIAMPLAMQALSPSEESMLLGLAAQKEEPYKPEIKKASDTTTSVLDLLKKLKMDFEDKAQELQTAEVKNKMNYDLALGGRTEQIRVATAAKVKKETALSLIVADIAANKQDTDSTQSDLDADSKTLMDVKTTIKVKKAEFKERTYMRDRESHQLQTAINVLSDAVGEKTGLIQVHWHAHAVMTEAAALDAKDTKAAKKAAKEAAAEPEVHPLAGAGKKADQAIEQQLWKVHDDKMKVKAEQQWCEKELSKTKLEKVGKEDAMAELRDQIDSTTASVASLIEEIAEAKAAISDAKGEMHEAKMDREKERQDNHVTSDEAATSQAALRKGAAALEKFYKDTAATAEASVDGAVKGLEDSPAVGFTESSFTGSSGSTSVVSLLETSADEYAKLEVDTKAEEAAAQQAFESTMKDLKTMIAKRETEVELKTAESSRLQEKVKEAEGDIKLTDRQHASIARYLKDVEDKCDVNFTAQVAAADAEAADLNESKQVIQDAFADNSSAALIEEKKSSLRFLQPLKLFGA
mmetsp:Transcript_77178/g.136208  ORF Transcript_77178/g.136208 Transcript_77178/m.136208 type:complete len:685 (-) Transcript_77178:88-2142(-)|eukprot:CAMPEP_0197655504 /NCGR_PEP_ID=MMETSP1338-20131121/39489_1 /TAXON_ID=43686 ORGANISM="Pelagodinium beii, Strain RCC1491" /NCGR_SAMPLE_ID=MMETSP1338 /ASSEMBLY_ACC=CAM_ASM_000754 /LENGTH=684 /DNA_ID=CAMNT_0043231157 /DNA_START=46 /DNA_END=2100 /DNA_ORIENTATION=-